MAKELDPVKIVESEEFQAAVVAMAAHKKRHPRATLDSLLLVAWAYLPISYSWSLAEAKEISGPQESPKPRGKPTA